MLWCRVRGLSPASRRGKGSPEDLSGDAGGYEPSTSPWERPLGEGRAARGLVLGSRRLRSDHVIPGRGHSRWCAGTCLGRPARHRAQAKVSLGSGAARALRLGPVAPGDLASPLVSFAAVSGRGCRVPCPNVYRKKCTLALQS